jgi:hypothetical protein
MVFDYHSLRTELPLHKVTNVGGQAILHVTLNHAQLTAFERVLQKAEVHEAAFSQDIANPESVHIQLSDADGDTFEFVMDEWGKLKKEA